MDSLKRRLGFWGAFIIPVVGLVGGLCVFWCFGVCLNVLDASGFIIELRFFHDNSIVDWIAYCVYGTPYENKKRSFQSNLTERILRCKKPWVLLGDLNCILSQSEKQGGRPFCLKDGKHLKDFLDDIGGLDLGAVGSLFSWHNNREIRHYVKERLDQAICDFSWCMLFPKSGVINLPIVGSDHAPVILDTCLERESLKFSFQFLEAWTCEPSCESVVHDAWNLQVE